MVDAIPSLDGETRRLVLALAVLLFGFLLLAGLSHMGAEEREDLAEAMRQLGEPEVQEAAKRIEFQAKNPLEAIPLILAEAEALAA